MRRGLGSTGGAGLIWALGGALFLAHVAHATDGTESAPTILLGVVLPALVSLGVVGGGVWLWRSSLGAATARRIGAWCVVGTAVLSASAALTIRSQQAHGVQMADRAFVVLSAASVGALIGFVIGLYDAQRHRQRAEIEARERALHDLHTTTRDLVRLRDREEIATRAVDAARDILNLWVSGCWLYDETEHALRPVAVTEEGTDLVQEVPTYTEGESLSWRAFETGEVMTFDDVSEQPDRHRSDTPIRSEIILPLGEHGVMNIGSTETGAFDEVDVSLAQILAANARTALERADREQQLAAARDQATRLNRQLTVLNRVFRHDLRNAANVIHGHAELLAEGAGDDTAESAATIREQAADLAEMSRQIRDIECVLQSEQNGRSVVDLVDLVEAELDRVERDYPAVRTDGPARDSCRVTAHSLVESAVRNVIDNAAGHNDAESPEIDVEIVDAGDDAVEVRIADNGPGIPDAEVAVLERGYETPLDHTSGLGLWLVSWIVRESDGEVSFRERDPRGSVVCLTFAKASAGAPEDDATDSETTARTTG